MQIQRFGHLADFKTMRDNYTSNWVTVVVMKNNSYSYVCTTKHLPPGKGWVESSTRGIYKVTDSI